MKHTGLYAALFLSGLLVGYAKEEEIHDFFVQSSRMKKKMKRSAHRTMDYMRDMME